MAVDRRIAKSRAAIEQAFVALMAEQSFDKITMRAVADRANVNRGTVYLHYADKFDLLDRIVENHFDTLRRLCRSASNLTYTEGNHVWFDYFAQHHTFFETMLAGDGARLFRERFRTMVLEELRADVDADGAVNAGLEPEIVLQFLASAVVGTVEWWLRYGMPLPPAVIAAQTGALLDRNL
jgi:AcrR family transcriptional regulator